MAAALYAAGSLICHQLPDRSFHLGDVQRPVCARCLGLYGGGAFGSASAAALSATLTRRPLAVRTRRREWAITVLAAMPTAATVIGEWGLGWPTSNVLRAVAGVPLGFTVAFVVLRALPTLHYETCAPPRPIASKQRPTNI